MKKKDKSNLYSVTRLAVGKSYTRQKIRIGLYKICGNSEGVLKMFSEILEAGFIKVAFINTLGATNYDCFLIEKNFYNE